MQRTNIKRELSGYGSAGSRLSNEEQLALLAAIVESSDDAIISKTLEGIITSWNSGAQRIFGYTAQEMIGLPITVLIPIDRLMEEPKIIERLRRGERVDHFETIRRTKDGRLIDISLTISPIRNGRGEIVGASKIARDITEIKNLERRKDDFIHMASHELKTPITSIKGYMQLASHIIATGELENFRLKYPELDTAINAVNKQVNKMVSLVSELLDLTRIQTGKLEIRKSEFPLAALLSETVKDIQTTTGKHRILLQCDYPGTIVADRDRLGQVIENLLTNAIKYSPNADKVDVKLETDHRFAHITVTDYGIGIAPADHKLIFDRFYRVEGKDEKTFPGFGIGLYVTSEIVREHGGHISLESERGKGASFTVHIPLK